MADEARTGKDARERGRALFQAHRWAEAAACLTSARDSLDGDAWILLGMSNYLVGEEERAISSFEQAYAVLIGRREHLPAARCTFWLAFVLLQRGEAARGSGWLARGQGLVEHEGGATLERGYLAILPAVGQLSMGDAAAAEQVFRGVHTDAADAGDRDLMTLARLGCGQAMLAQGQVPAALRTLDEAMVAVMADEVTPVIAGLVYCAVIEACHQGYDLRRASEWTDGLEAWCEARTDLVPFRGQCQVHRVEMLRLHGAWREALEKARSARQRLSRPPVQPAVGAAIYQEAELLRLRGRYQRAEEAYAQAGESGHELQPGLARLRLAQGDVEVAVAGLRRALDEPGGRERRPRLLAAYVEATLAAGDHATAASAAAELTALADRHDAEALRATASSARAAIALDQGDPSAALKDARAAWAVWHRFGAPYEAARARVLIGLSCERLGDRDAADLELGAARRAFQQLGARGDIVELERATRGQTGSAPGGLTPRETEVLREVSTGKTNRQVAEQLHLSEKTVARHLSNIYTKLGVSSRAGATAWAYEHDAT